jgi:DNA-binding IclR family transcriptional regulator
VNLSCILTWLQYASQGLQYATIPIMLGRVARPSPQTERVVKVVELLAAHPDEAFSLASVTRRLGVNKSTCHSMLTALAGAGWLVRDPFAKTYRLGPALVAVSRAAGTGFPALDFAHTAMVELSVELHVNCAALAVADNHVTVVDQVHDVRAIGAGLPLGTSLPLRPPFGTVVIAWAPEMVDGWLANAPDETHDHYRAALDATRGRGFAVEITTTPETRLREMVSRLRERDGSAVLGNLVDELARELTWRDDVLPLQFDTEREYVVSAVNAPVFNHAGQVTLVLSLTGFAAPLSGRQVMSVGRRLVEATKALTAAVSGPW